MRSGNDTTFQNNTVDHYSSLESLSGPLIGAKNSCHTYLGIDMCFKDKKLQLSKV
jgi:hypothetical protein